MVKDWFAVIDLDLVTVVEDLKKVGSLGVGVAATRAAVAEQPSLVCCPPKSPSLFIGRSYTEGIAQRFCLRWLTTVLLLLLQCLCYVHQKRSG